MRLVFCRFEALLFLKKRMSDTFHSTGYTDRNHPGNLIFRTVFCLQEYTEYVEFYEFIINSHNLEKAYLHCKNDQDTVSVPDPGRAYADPATTKKLPRTSFSFSKPFTSISHNRPIFYLDSSIADMSSVDLAPVPREFVISRIPLHLLIFAVNKMSFMITIHIHCLRMLNEKTN